MLKPLEIPVREVQRRMADDNPWWMAGQGIDPERRAWPHRAYFHHFANLIGETSVRRAVVLIGPRRVGKTVMLMQSIQQLLDQGVTGTTLLYISLDTPLYSGRSLESLARLFMEQHAHSTSSRLWIFFDEIQYLKDWEVHLKSLVDSFPHFRFIASGSAAATLHIKSRESGAGRFTEFVLPPLTFAEYLDFAGKEQALIVERGVDQDGAPSYQATHIEALNEEFINYLNYGGFPEAVMSPAVRGNPTRYLRQDIVDKVLLKDLPSLFGIGDTQELNRFFNVLAFNTGDELSLEALYQHAGIGKQRIADYLEYLEAAFLIQRVYRVDDNALRMKRARTFKVYLTNPSIRAALFGFVRQDDAAMGSLAETAVWSQWLHSTDLSRSLHYARWKSGRQDLEVDIVSLDPVTQKPRIAVEIKWSDRIVDQWSDLRGIREFTGKHHLPMPLVTTRTTSAQGASDTQDIRFTPTSLYCYTVARNLLRQEL
jgi:predicted AAA+ superfamily ATPase